MSIGTQFATRNEVEILRRKLERPLSGAGITQHIIIPPVIENFIDLADTPSTYAAAGYFAVRVKSTVDELEFAELKGTTNQVYITPHAADYTFSLPQDIHYAATPTFAGMYLESASIAPFLKLTNESNTERDPIIQYAVGATPVVRWTHGLDDSLLDDWLLCVGGELTDTPSEETYDIETTYDGYLVICDTSNSRIKKHLASNGAYQAKIGTTGSGDNQFNLNFGICSDGTYVYVTDGANNRIKKHQLSDLSFVAAFGTSGTGNNNFDTPRGICTDGIYLYIVDRGNYRIKKHLCSDLSYVAQSSGPGFIQPDYICIDGTFVYTIQTSGPTYRIFKHYTYDLALSLRVMPGGGDGHIDSVSVSGICTTGGYLYILNANPDPLKPFWKYACSDLTYVSNFGTFGHGDGEFTSPNGIATDGTNLFVSDSYGTNDQRIQKLLLDGTYVLHFGDYGIGDDQFNIPRGLCVSGTIVREILIPHSGPILRASEDASSLQSYVSFWLRNEIRFLENSVANANYIAIQAPASVTSYKLILPGATAGAKKNLQVGATDILAWAQNVDTDGSPTFVKLYLSATSNQIVLQSTGITGTITATPASSNKVWTLQNVTGTIYQTGGTDVAVADGGTNKSAWTLYAIPYASGTTTIGEIAIGTAGQVLAVNGGANGYEWIAAGGGGAFLTLTDVDEPNYTGHAGHFVVVNGDEDALIFSASSVATHDVLSVTHGDTLASAVSVGSMIFGNATPKWAELNAGIEGQILEMGATLPGWGRTITISDSAASGGSNGDIWLEY